MNDALQPVQATQQDFAVQLLGAVQHLLGRGDRFVNAVERLAASAERWAEVHAPPPADKVDSTYVAERLDVTTTWVAANARDGKIPDRCIVSGTGNGTPWKFYRERIDEWIKNR